MKKTSILITLLLTTSLLTGCAAAAPATEPAISASVETSAPVVTEEAATTEETAQETEPVMSPKVLPDGVYTVDFETDSSMFQASEACDRKGTLTVKDGVQTLHVSLQSKGIVNLYLGTAEQAQQPGAVWLEHTVDTVTYSDGLSEEVFGFDVPVTDLGEEFDLALIGKKGVWYDHKVSVCNPIPQTGNYTCAVELIGGSGRASVSSPAMLASDGEALTATIVWSSPNYEYMILDGVQYDPIQMEGNSTFEIPVTLDQDLAVSASTTAMSTPHLVEYTLRFDSTTLTLSQGE